MRKVKKWLALLVATMLALQPLAFPVSAAPADDVAPPEALGAIPTETQLQYHEEELSAFIHFGVNTFTGVEWGNGRGESKRIPSNGLGHGPVGESPEGCGF